MFALVFLMSFIKSEIYIIHLPFCTKVVCAAFLYLNFGFVIFGQKNIGTKAACKMLKKLTITS